MKFAIDRSSNIIDSPEFISFVQFGASVYPNYNWPQNSYTKNKQVIWKNLFQESPFPYMSGSKAETRFGVTDIDFFVWLCDLVKKNTNKWDYAVFMLSEEIFNPMIYPSSTWKLTGSATVAGITLEAYHTWSIRKYGSIQESKAQEWANEYFLNLHRAWVEMCHSIGKKAAIISVQYSYQNKYEQTSVSN